MKKLKALFLLFLTMFKIGLFTFGGGYAMIAVIERELVERKKWLSHEEFMDMVAIAESTPGPIAVNMATFVGSTQGGILGAFLATLGIVLPSFIIILIVASVANNLLKYAGVKATLTGMRPAIVGLIVSVTITMFLKQILNLRFVESSVNIDWYGFIILGILALITVLYTKFRKKALSPILLIVISGILGIIFY